MDIKMSKQVKQAKGGLIEWSWLIVLIGKLDSLMTMEPGSVKSASDGRSCPKLLDKTEIL